MTPMMKITAAATAFAAVIAVSGTTAMADAQTKANAVALLEQGLVQNDAALMNELVAEDYIQHNPVAPDGRAGLLGFAGYLQSLEAPISVNPVRVLQEGNLVVVHSEYDIAGKQAIFDLFRVEDGKFVEHWDGIQDIPAKTASGRSMTDGPTEITDLDLTEANKALVVGFVTDVLMNGEGAKVTNYIGDVYHQHNPNVGDGLEGLGAFIGYLSENEISFGYSQIHNVVAEGNFVFTQSEGDFGGQPTAFYDLFRVEDGQIVEHWDVVQDIPAEMAHSNGMF